MVRYGKENIIGLGGAGPLQAERVHARLSSVDFLRGLVIVIMALDHVREWFTAANFEPTDINETNAAYFFTRWITHFCAPVFILLAGTGAGLSLQKGGSRRDLSLFLLTRGAWLVVVEIVVMNWIFFFQLIPPFYVLQVIWAIGVSMIVLAGLIHLPRTAIIIISVVMIMGHNLLDTVGAAAGSPADIVASGGS